MKDKLSILMNALADSAESASDQKILEEANQSAESIREVLKEVLKTQKARDVEFAHKCAEVYTKRTGHKNLLGGVKQNFETIVPIILEEIRKRMPRL